MDGFVNIIKPSGPTSHDIVYAVRRALPRKTKVGHAGTLDPMAEGVLVVAVGKATRALEYMDSSVKTYEAKLRLGVITDSQDTTGEVAETRDASFVTEDMLREVVESFKGEIEQIPPMVSAVKVDGKRLYKLAREGKTVERQPRKITVYDISCRYGGGDADLTVTCSSGTYIRTLCHDIGAKLGCGGAMSALKRTRVGAFTYDRGITAEEFAAAEDKESLLLPIADALGDMPRKDLNDNEFLRICRGLEIRGEGEGLVLALRDGKAAAICAAEEGVLRPRKVFAEAD